MVHTVLRNQGVLILIADVKNETHRKKCSVRSSTHTCSHCLVSLSLQAALTQVYAWLCCGSVCQSEKRSRIRRGGATLLPFIEFYQSVVGDSCSENIQSERREIPDLRLLRDYRGGVSQKWFITDLPDQSIFSERFKIEFYSNHRRKWGMDFRCLSVQNLRLRDKDRDIPRNFSSICVCHQG